MTRPWGNVITANQAIGNEEQTLTAKQLQAIHQRGVVCPVCGEQQRVNGRPLSPRELKGAKRFCSNMACRAPLFQFKRRRSGVSKTRTQQRGSFKLYAEREKAILQAIVTGSPHHLVTPAPHHLHGYGKIPLAGYIKKVETGIDLLDFPTIVWMSPHHIRKLKQSSRVI